MGLTVKHLRLWPTPTSRSPKACWKTGASNTASGSGATRTHDVTPGPRQGPRPNKKALPQGGAFFIAAGSARFIIAAGSARSFIGAGSARSFISAGSARVYYWRRVRAFFHILSLGPPNQTGGFAPCAHGAPGLRHSWSRWDGLPAVLD